MQKLIGGFALLILVGASGSTADAAPWCAFYGSSTYNCGFYTYEQCLATIRGTGGTCRQNFLEGNPGRQNQPSGKRAREDRWWW